MANFPKLPLLLAAAPFFSQLTDCGGGTETPKRRFDAPQAVAVAPWGDSLPPALHAFVADTENRALRAIDVEDRDVEDRLPTSRSLAALVPQTGAAGVAEAIWGIDRNRGELVRVDLETALTPTVSDWTFTGSGFELDDLSARPGRAATSAWTVTYREGIDRWEVESISGVQNELAKTGDSYTSDEKEVRFRIRRTVDGAQAAEGDQFTFTTDNGLEAIGIGTGGNAVNLAAAGLDGTDAVLALEGPGSLIAFDLESRLAHQTFGLSIGAIPAGMASTPDGTALWVADLGNPVLYRIDTSAAPGAWTIATVPMPLPMRELAITGDGARLFALAADADDVFVFALPDATPVDLVGRTPEIDPLRLGVAIRTLSAARMPVVMRGNDVPGYPVIVSTHAGNLFFLNGSSGCVDWSSRRGPSVTGIRFRDSATTSNPTFDFDVFEVTTCGGFIRNENWTLTFNGLLDAWEVTGSLSGKQQAVLREGETYTTDLGEITMRIVGDPSLPSDDGDQFIFSITDGISPLSVGSVPERPAYGVVGEGEDATEYAFVPASGSDTVSQVNVERRRVSRTYR